MLIKTLFELAAKQDDKTNLVRLWTTAMGLPDAVTLLPELNNEYGPLIVQSMMEFRDEDKATTAFEDITEALDCIVYQKQFAGPQYNAELAGQAPLREVDYSWLSDRSIPKFGTLPPKLVKPEAEPGSVNEHWLSRGYSWCENNWVWVKDGEDPAQTFRNLWDQAMSETK